MNAKHLIITNAGFDSATDLTEDNANIAANSVGIFKTGKTTGVVNAYSELGLNDKFQIMARRGSGSDVYTTPELTFGEITHIEKATYNAGSAQVTTVTCPAGSDSYEFLLRILDSQSPIMEGWTVSFEDTTEVMTATQVAAKLALLVNAKPGLTDFVTATSSGATLTLTGNTTNTIFAIALAQDLEGATNNTTGNVPEVGTPAEVTEKETYLNAVQHGKLNRVWFPKDIPTMVDSTKTYDMLAIRFVLEASNTSFMQGVQTYDFTLYIAEATDATTSLIEHLYTSYLALTGSTVAAPTVTDLAGSHDVGDVVTIAGTGFNGVVKLEVGAINQTVFTINSDTSITFTIAASTVDGKIKVTNGLGVSAQSDSNLDIA